MPDRFNDYRPIKAKRNDTGTCTHPIKSGDFIGWNPRNKHTQCAQCWDRWTRENAAADFDERQAEY